MVKTPLLLRLFFITVERESKTELTCLFERPVSLEIAARISDLVGGELFFAISISCGCVTGLSPAYLIGGENSTRLKCV